MKTRPNPPPTQPPSPWRPEIEPLPQRDTPYPDDRPLDPDEVKSALWHGQGNIREAASLLRTPPARLGALLRKDPVLAEVRAQAAELLVDSAEQVLLQALASPDEARADHAAQFVLERAGRGRGWTRDGSLGVGVAVAFEGNGVKAGVTIRWQTETD